jgi:hypothetical protein
MTKQLDNNLFEEEETHTFNPRDEWKNMPEFVQEKQEPFAKIIVRFDSAEALEEFSKLIGQKLTPKTKSIWHPQLVRGLNASKRWVDES